MNSYLINKYRRELYSYTFSENKFKVLMNEKPRKKEVLNESINRTILANTSKDVYMNDGKLIYYKSLSEVNDHIIEWIDIFNMKVKYTINVYSCYIDTLNNIRKEINLYAMICASKYGLVFSTSGDEYDTLIKVYINILWERKLKIANELRIILEDEFGLYYGDYSREILGLYNYYQRKILSIEEIDLNLFNAFRDEVGKIINKPRMLLKESRWSLNGN